MKFFSLILCMSLVFSAFASESSNLVDPVGRPLDSKELSNPARFKNIKAKAATAREEVDFWSRQMSEHALFMHLGMEDAALKKRGLAIHKKFEDFRGSMNENNLSKVLPLTRELRAYKMDIVRTLDQGKWIGWIFPSFARHITQELDYFVDKLNDVRYSSMDETDFWNHINSDHAAFASHLFDPYQEDLSKKALKLSEKIADLPDSEEDMFIRISLKAAKELDAFNKKGRELSKQNKVQSVIHPVLLDHVIREGERSTKKLRELEQAARSEGSKQGTRSERFEQEMGSESTESNA